MSFTNLINTLLAMANYRPPSSEESIIRFIRYPADTLYLLTENQDAIASKLLDLGKKWQADTIEVFDSQTRGEEGLLSEFSSIALKQGLKWQPGMFDTREAIVVCFWWD